MGTAADLAATVELIGGTLERSASGARLAP